MVDRNEITAADVVNAAAAETRIAESSDNLLGKASEQLRRAVAMGLASAMKAGEPPVVIVKGIDQLMRAELMLNLMSNPTHSITRIQQLSEPDNHLGGYRYVIGGHVLLIWIEPLARSIRVVRPRASRIFWGGDFTTKVKANITALLQPETTPDPNADEFDDRVNPHYCRSAKQNARCRECHIDKYSDK